MKKITAVVSVILVITMLFASAAYASSLEIEGITPSDGKKGLQTTNIAVKVEFNEDMSNTANDDVNLSKFVLRKVEANEDGTHTEYSKANGNVQLVHSEKYPDELWYVIDATIDSDTEYVIELQDGIVASNGEKLTSSVSSGFKTRNTKTDGYISIVMMVGMMVIMVIASTKAAKKQQQQNDPKYVEKQREEALNPYKIAKEKNISLDEAKAYVAKEKEKYKKEKEKAAAEQAKKDAERQAEIDAFEAKIEAEMAARRDEYIYHVKGPKSITLTGREVPKAVAKLKKKRVDQAAAKEKAAAAERLANSKGKKSKK